ncbi:HAD family hydrolase [Vibrio splendidus]|uniref:HAD family hydrolase n=2 Tax=Vibrio splendidus TaxID=29497 RepID=UPI000D3D9AD0|nr:HAD-IB family hydrolase [Vibrio splendidus]PTO78726.1 HAD-IB family hydrolase [Vibrio splendidus]
MKIAIFDFCDTLVSFQTADEFIKYCAIRRNKVKFYFFETLRYTLRRLRILRGSANKKFLLRYIKGMKKEEIELLAEEYFENRIKCKLIDNTLESLRKLKSRGYKVIIISGGYECYIQKFSESFNCDEVIATEIEFVDGVATGKIEGLDCMGVNKIYKLNKVIDIQDIHYNESYTFSDHDSDIYIFCLVKNRFVIRRQGYDQNWAHLLGCKFLDEDSLN